MQHCLAPSRRTTVILGDTNARVGKRKCGDDPDPDEVLGLHGVDQKNSMRERMINRCKANGFRIMKTSFQHNIAHTQSWYRPKGQQPDHLDCLTQTKDADLIPAIKMRPNVEVDSDHALGIATIRQWLAVPDNSDASPMEPAHDALRGRPLGRLRIELLKNRDHAKSYK